MTTRRTAITRFTIQAISLHPQNPKIDASMFHKSAVVSSPLAGSIKQIPIDLTHPLKHDGDIQAQDMVSPMEQDNLRLVFDDWQRQFPPDIGRPQTSGNMQVSAFAPPLERHGHGNEFHDRHQSRCLPRIFIIKWRTHDVRHMLRHEMSCKRLKLFSWKGCCESVIVSSKKIHPLAGR